MVMVVLVVMVLVSVVVGVGGGRWAPGGNRQMELFPVSDCFTRERGSNERPAAHAAPLLSLHIRVNPIRAKTTQWVWPELIASPLPPRLLFPLSFP